MEQRYSPDDPVELYLHEVSSLAPLSKQEEEALLRELSAIELMDEQWETVARRLIESQLPTVVRVAREYSSSGISMLDLIEHGNISLLKAVRSYSQSPKGDFAAYVAERIRRDTSSFVLSQNG